jgi:hypothetical protein
MTNEDLERELGEDLIPAEETEVVGELSTTLSRLVQLHKDRDAAAAALKSIQQQMDTLEALAAEQLKASGLDNCRVAGKTWWVDETLLLSVPKEHRDAVLAAAATEGIAEELTTVNTITLKAWLQERAREKDLPLADAVKSTAFSGLVDDFVKVRLRSRTVG